MKFIITVDTEADNQWGDGGEASLKNIEGLPRFQALCERFGFVPTYLVTSEVAADDQAVYLLSSWQNAGRAEVGAHLHPWTTPPFDEKDKSHAYPSELGDQVLRKKLENLTNLITERVGRTPTSYRAGRFGFDDRQAKILAGLGYVADCSVTPKVSWQKLDKWGSRGPDFRSASVWPYRLADSLWEIPLTILLTGPIRKEDLALVKKFLLMNDGLIKKILNKLFFQLKWLRIFPNSNSSAWSKILKSARDNNLPVVEFIIHSSELWPGTSPYAKDAAAVEKIYQELERMFALFKREGLSGVTLSQFARGL